MSNSTGTPAVAGIDVGESRLDARALCHSLRRLGISRVVCEPTGRNHR